MATSTNSSGSPLEITVEDTISPTITSPEDFSYAVGTTGHIISWHPDDLGPSSYTINLDGSVVKSGSWNTTLENITYSVDGFSVGEHTIILTVTDIGGHSTTDTVVVTVTSGIDTTTMILIVGAGGVILVVLAVVYLSRRKGTST